MTETATYSQVLPSGYRLGDYIVDCTLGRGGFGITYLAHSREDGSRVVIKENLPHDYACRDEETRRVVPVDDSPEGRANFDWALRNFYKEAKLMASLNHPGIVRVSRAFHALGTAYYVMPYVGGMTLDRWLAANPEPSMVVHMLQALLSALQYLHGRDILHRDIKPQNIIVQEDGNPVLIDFGTARQIINERTATTVAAFASPGYTPFEQTQAHGKTGPWTDIYALGGTMFHVITGARPLDCRERMGDEGDDPLVPLCQRKELVSRYGKPLLSGIDKAMQVSRSRRWQCASDWLQALPGAPVRFWGGFRSWRRICLVLLPVALFLLVVAVAWLYWGSQEDGGAPAFSTVETAPVPGPQKEEPRETPSPEEKAAPGAMAVHMDPNKRLITAAKAGDKAQVQSLLEQGVDVNTCDEYGRTPLHMATWQGKLEVVELLLGHGADINSKDDRGWTPLHDAAWEDRADAASLLIASGADIDAKDTRGRTPLHKAAWKGHSAVVEVLLVRGADVQAKNDGGATPLHEAVLGKHVEVALLLIAHGADANAEDNNGATPLKIAEDLGITAIADYLRLRGLGR